MKNNVLILTIGIVAIVGIGVFALSQQTSVPPKTTVQEAPQKTPPVNKDNAIVKDTAASRYVEYSKGALEQASSHRRVLFFYANWCPTCRPADTNFQENVSNMPENMTVIRVNYNDTETDQEEKDLARKYGITYQHTFVQIDGQGNEITKWNGGQFEQLLANIK